MPVQMSIATSNVTEVYMHSKVNPAPGMVNTNTAQSFMCWLSVSGAALAAVTSMVGAYNGTHDGSTLPTTGLQIGCRGGATPGMMVWTYGGVILVDTNPGGIGVITPYSPVIDEWFHIVYTCTTLSGANQTHSLYVNGVLKSQATHALQNAGLLTQIYINGYPHDITSGGETGDVKVDDIRFYSRQLSVDEVLTIYNSRGGVDGITDGLVASFPFEEGIIDTAIVNVSDVSGYTNDLITQNNGGNSMVYIAGVTGNNVRQPHI